MGTHVRVLVRARPLLPHEEGLTTDVVECGGNYVRVAYNNGTNKTFTFDKVLNPSCQQDDVFEEVDPLIDHALDGLHATVFCYGQTGSGKTFTMEGFDYGVTQNGKLKPLMEIDPGQHGVILRSIECIFAKVHDRMGSNPRLKYKLQCSYMQLYNEKVFDLLNPNATLKAAEKSKSGSAGLRIRWGKDDQFFVENLFVFECDDAEQVRELFQMGVKNKNMGSHQMNLASSRSHSIFTFYVTSWDTEAPDCVLRSQLTLVDLAGSEKLTLLAKNPSSKLVQESIDINTSLLALGKVIQALGSDQRAAHVPYRDSKLTRLLKHALGGNSMTIMIACINPADTYVDETLCTLFYAGRARNIKNDPHVNEDPKSAMIRVLKEEIAQLKVELENYRKLLLEDNSSLGRAAMAHKGEGGGAAALALAGDGDAAYLAERLVESVRIVRELVEANGQLRTNFDRINELKLKAEAMVQQVNEENVELQERIEMLESIVVQQADDDDDPAARLGASREGAPGGTMRRQAKKAFSAYQQRYRAKQTKGLANYHEVYKSQPQPAHRNTANGTNGQAGRFTLVDRQQEQQQRMQQYQNQHLQLLQEQQRQRLQQQQQYQQQMAQYLQQQQQQQPRPSGDVRSSTNNPAFASQVQAPASLQRSVPGAPPPGQPPGASTKASAEAQTAAAIWLQHKNSTDVARQQLSQNPQVLQQQQQFLLQQHQLYQQQLAQVQALSHGYGAPGPPQGDRKTHSSPPVIGGTPKLPFVAQDVLNGSRVNVTASPVRAQSSGGGTSGATPQPHSWRSEPATTASSFLSLDEYKQHFTPEQLAVLAKRNAMTNNYVQK
eukprot:GGOE01001420.1.p1 GENE.GGOE01001420.1~~GGOE01001420.1.p1  ORF type:complete len:832 (+),score=230.34 GGOE01001420.1:91-2586(+)